MKNSLILSMLRPKRLQRQFVYNNFSRSFGTAALAISGQAKVEYAFETARIRLHLPFKGETWFFVDNHMSVQEFKEQCLGEDNHVKELQFINADTKEHIAEESQPLYNLLTKDSTPLLLKINETYHQFPRICHEYLKYDLEDLEWFKKCGKKGLPATHATTLTAFINQVETQLKEKQGQIKGQADLISTFAKSLHYFDDVVVREQIYRLNLKRVQLIDEIKKLEVTKSQLDNKASRRNMFFFTSTFLFFSAQFAVSYYCIWEVDWIGWDLFEPLTYTLCQGMFVGGILYSLRNWGKETSFSSIDTHYKEKKLEKWYLKNGLDPDRLDFLKEELQRIEGEISKAESQRYS